MMLQIPYKIQMTKNHLVHKYEEKNLIPMVSKKSFTVTKKIVHNNKNFQTKHVFMRGA